MTVMEPVGRPVDPAEAQLLVEEALPEQREAAATQVADLEVDHVRRHAQSCYWDFRVARWECVRD